MGKTLISSTAPIVTTASISHSTTICNIWDVGTEILSFLATPARLQLSACSRELLVCRSGLSEITPTGTTAW